MGRRRTPSLSTQRVLAALLEDPTIELYGLEISGRAGLPSGTIYPMLARLEQLGWLSSRWEEIDSRLEGRRPRRYYKLTGLGVRETRLLLAETDQWLRSARSLSLQADEGLDRHPAALARRRTVAALRARPQPDRDGLGQHQERGTGQPVPGLHRPGTASRAGRPAAAATSCAPPSSPTAAFLYVATTWRF
jgi:PadR family transcriptional regulator PadR